jgi:uncharacterized protein
MPEVMPAITPSLIALVAGGGAAAGALGALLGIGGGMFLVPLLTLAGHMPIKYAIPISLATVIATSTAVSAGTAGRGLINLRLGMVLEVATAAGGLLGGITAERFSPSTLFAGFGFVSAASALSMLTRLGKRNVIVDADADPGQLGGRYYEDESGGIVVYRVKRLPLALGASFVAGSVSTILGIGGGVIKVPILNAWCGVPLRAAAATSAFMIGVTATTGVVLYYGKGELIAVLAAAAVLGVRAGSSVALLAGARAPAQWLKMTLIVVLLTVSALMFARGL